MQTMQKITGNPEQDVKIELAGHVEHLYRFSGTASTVFLVLLNTHARARTNAFSSPLFVCLFGLFVSLFVRFTQQSQPIFSSFPASHQHTSPSFLQTGVGLKTVGTWLRFAVDAVCSANTRHITAQHQKTNKTKQNKTKTKQKETTATAAIPTRVAVFVSWTAVCADILHPDFFTASKSGALVPPAFCVNQPRGTYK